MDTVLSTPERDPRVDPRPGDVLKRGSRKRTVIEHSGPTDSADWITFETPRGKREGYITQERREHFRKWASNAQVIRKVEE